MAKKELMIPYVEIDTHRYYLTYRHNHQETAIIRDHEGYWTKPLPILEHPAETFGAHMRILDGHRGRSAAQVEVQDVATGYKYTVFFQGFIEAVKMFGVTEGFITGRFRHVKRGSNYGIEATNG